MKLTISGQLEITPDSNILSDPDIELSYGTGTWSLKTGRSLATNPIGTPHPNALRIHLDARFEDKEMSVHAPPPVCQEISSKLSEVVKEFSTSLQDLLQELLAAGAVYESDEAAKPSQE